jgi:DNA repair protein RAD16
MAYYQCRASHCDCKSIHYRMQQGRCLDCSHPSMMHYSVFNRMVLNPIQRDGYSGDGRRAMFLLRDSVLNTCLLRRTKQNRSADMNLPPRLVKIRNVRLHPVEEDFYEALYTQTKSSFDDYVAEGTLLNNYAHIFDLLTKMRQAVDHPYLIVHSKINSIRQAGQRAASVSNGSTDCAMCHEPPTNRIVSSCCSGALCRSCVIEYLAGAGGENTPCPSCAAPFSIDLNQSASDDVVDDGALAVPSSEARSSNVGVPSLKEMPHVHTGSILRRINLAEFATSTKIEVLVQELISMRRERPGSKALVFSQFVNMLDLIRWRLHSDPCLADLGLGVRILHGGMDIKSRDAALKDFREDSKCRVLLMSLKAAGVALNLTVASEVILMDLWWNVSHSAGCNCPTLQPSLTPYLCSSQPAAELQAIDRCHRLGQYRPIRATRLVAEGKCWKSLVHYLAFSERATKSNLTLCLSIKRDRHRRRTRSSAPGEEATCF